MYLDRIFAPQELALLQSKVSSKADMPNLKCPKCGALIGTPMVYEKESSMKNGVNFRTSVFQFRPYHGTELYHDMILKGRIIDEVVYSENLSTNIGRKQFNFTSGNFSEVSDEILRGFITKTNGINR